MGLPEHLSRSELYCDNKHTVINKDGHSYGDMNEIPEEPLCREPVLRPAAGSRQLTTIAPLNGSVRRRSRQKPTTIENICPYCARNFKYRVDFVRHLRVHTQERPFKCTHCSYGASQKGNLERHIRHVHRITKDS